MIKLILYSYRLVWLFHSEIHNIVLGSTLVINKVQLQLSIIENIKRLKFEKTKSWEATKGCTTCTMDKFFIHPKLEAPTGSLRTKLRGKANFFV